MKPNEIPNREIKMRFWVVNGNSDRVAGPFETNESAWRWVDHKERETAWQTPYNAAGNVTVIEESEEQQHG